MTAFQLVRPFDYLVVCVIGKSHSRDAAQDESPSARSPKEKGPTLAVGYKLPYTSFSSLETIDQGPSCFIFSPPSRSRFLPFQSDHLQFLFVHSNRPLPSQVRVPCVQCRIFVEFRRRYSPISKSHFTAVQRPTS